MFTGIIEEIGTIRNLVPMGTNQSRLSIECHKVQDDLKIGDSVAVDGICLTVVRYDSEEIVLELSTETLQKSLFGEKAQGTKVNLERALRLGDRLGGHMVQGHVDSLSTVLNVHKMGDFYKIAFTIDSKVAQYFVNKGSVTINGISLTIASLKGDRFTVAVIPHTYLETTLSELKVSDRVHIETDVVARYIERLLPFAKKEEEKEESSITYDFLKKHGF